jgi:hypothetical protein
VIIFNNIRRKNKFYLLDATITWGPSSKTGDSLNRPRVGQSEQTMGLTIAGINGWVTIERVANG